MTQVAKEVVYQIRFTGDKQLQESLLKDRSLKKETDAMLKDQTKHAKSHLRSLLGQSLRISSSSSPDIYKQFLHCQKTLHLQDKELHPFIYNSPEINAYCFYDGKEITIGVSSQLIKIMSPTELTFIIGHEFGHALYEHYKLPAFGLCQGRLPPSKALKLMSWSRQAEISADRAGLLCCQDIGAATISFIKMSCGLGEPYVSFDIEDFVSQVDEIEKLENADNADECYSTHPLSPLRVLALNNFWLSDSYTQFFKTEETGEISDEEMDQKIFEILNYMEPESSKQSKKRTKGKQDDFLMVSSYFVAVADDDFAKKELTSLKDICGEENVEAFLKEIEKEKDQKKILEKKLVDLSSQYKKSKKPTKCSTIQKIVTIARSDGHLSEPEKDALYKVANLIGVKEDFVDQILKFLD